MALNKARFGAVTERAPSRCATLRKPNSKLTAPHNIMSSELRYGTSAGALPPRQRKAAGGGGAASADAPSPAGVGGAGWAACVLPGLGTERSPGGAPRDGWRRVSARTCPVLKV